MPMPRLPATQKMTSETTSADQVNVKSAASAPAWNTIIVMMVSQLIRTARCLFVGSLFMSLTFLISSRT